jgi:putative transcriptional regulator
MNYKGKLLVATPELKRDPTFKQSVVYIYEHNEEVVLGMILNKPTDFKVNEIVRMEGYNFSGVYDKLYKGGPVSPQSCILFHTDEWYSSNTMQIGNGLALSSDEMMFEKLSMGNEPDQCRLMAGVSSWHPQQLEEEIHKWKAWLVAEADPSIFFHKDGIEQWNKAIMLTSQQIFDQYF